MILDLILDGQAYVLKMHKKFFQNRCFPLSLFQGNNHLADKYAYLGKFEIEGKTFGFDGCFKKRSEEGEYFIYRFDFPKSNQHSIMRRMLVSVLLSTHYVLDSMYEDKEFFDEGIWDDQSLCFFIFEGMQNGYEIEGTLYPWFKERLYSLSDNNLADLKTYVLSEIKSIYLYFMKKELFYSQVDITKESFFIQVGTGGRWISWKKKHDLDRLEEFDSHNIDFSIDQELCFEAIIAMNTWLRKNT